MAHKDRIMPVRRTRSAKPQGTGLGLSVARTIIETCGGRIWAENNLGGGAAFRFTLPLVQPVSCAVLDIARKDNIALTAGL